MNYDMCKVYIHSLSLSKLVELPVSRRLETLDLFSAILYKGNNFCDFLCVFIYNKAPPKRSLL